MARRKDRNELLAGGLIVVAVVLAVAVVMLLADWRLLLEAKKLVRVVFLNQSIRELKAGTPVRYHGLAIGAVRKVEFDPARPDNIQAVIEIRGDLKLFANASLSVQTGPLGGSPIVEIDNVGRNIGLRQPAGGELHLPADRYLPLPGPTASQPDVSARPVPEPVPLADADHPIYSREPTNEFIADATRTMGFGDEQRTQLQRTIFIVSQAAERIDQMLVHIQTDTLGKVDAGLGQLVEVTSAGVPLMKSLNQRIPAAMDGIDAAVSQVRKLVTDVSPVIGDAIGKFDSLAGTLDGGAKQQLANLQAAMTQLRDGLNKANESMDNLRQFTRTARDLAAANRDTINDTLSSLHEAAEQMAGAMADIRRAPWRLFHTPKPEEERSANLLDATRAYAEGASSLRDAATRLSALVTQNGAQFKADDPQYRKLLANLAESQAKFDKAERTLYELLKSK